MIRAGRSGDGVHVLLHSYSALTFSSKFILLRRPTARVPENRNSRVPEP
jgi:hypothetical protein